MPKKKLTATGVKNAGPGMHSAGGGLYLAVARGGSRSWIYRYQFRSKRRDMGLGSASVVTLAEARDLAYEARRLLVFSRIDPIEHRRQAEAAATTTTKAVTFEACAQEHLMNRKTAWSVAYEKNWAQGMRDHVYPKIGKLPVGKIDIDALVELLKPFNGSKLAVDLRSRIGGVLDAAIGKKLLVGENPAKSKYLTTLLPKPAKVQKLPALAYNEIAAFMLQLRADSSITNRAMEFAILCASRRDEVREAPWSEIDMTNRWWTIPAERMKNREEHRVPLSGAAMAVLHQMAAIRTNDFVFPGREHGTLAEGAIHKVVTKLRPDITPHGFRSTFSTWLREETEFDTEMGEVALAHRVGTTVAQRYQRGTMLRKRTLLMETWADYCAGVEPGLNVVPLRA